MSLLTCNKLPVVAMRMTLPINGVWVASLEVDSDTAITGAVTIADDESSYKGTVVRSGVQSSSCYIEAVGGAGGIAKDVKARSFIGASAKAILSDTLALVSERLDPSSSASALNTNLTYWTRAAGRAGAAIALLADALGVDWRVLPNGNVWLGAEAWPAMPASFDAVELSIDPASGTVELAPESFALAPGKTLGTRRVGRVEHSVGRDRPVRTLFWEATT